MTHPKTRRARRTGDNRYKCGICGQYMKRLAENKWSCPAWVYDAAKGE